MNFSFASFNFVLWKVFTRLWWELHADSLDDGTDFCHEKTQTLEVFDR